jgi:hypothetical protein
MKKLMKSGLVIQKFIAPRPLSRAKVASIRRDGTLNRAERLTTCKACGQPILIGTMRVTGRFGYLNGLTGHVHEVCP